MTAIGKFTLRLGIYGAVFVYLICDLYCCHGPLSRKLRNADPNSPEAAARARAQGTVAVVYGNPLNRRQLDRAVAERLWTEGRIEADLTPAARKLVRYAALDDLIDHELLRMKVKVNAESFKLSAGEIDARFQAFVKRFATAEELAAALQAEGLGGEAELRERLAARLQQEKYVESRIGPQAKPSEADARQWYDAHRIEISYPERRELRHVFIATLERPSEDARKMLEPALAALQEGTKDFVTLARELSEDEATKAIGGQLGWLTRSRLPTDFATAVFALEPKQPALINTKLGWHLVEATAVLAAAPQSFEQAKPEIFAALEALNRRRLIAEFRSGLRQMETRAITIYHEVVEQ